MDQEVSGAGLNPAAAEKPKNDFQLDSESTRVKDESAKAVETAQTEEPKKDVEQKSTENEENPEKDSSEGSKKHRRGGFQKKIARLEAENAALRAQSSGAVQKTVETKLERPNPENFQTNEEYVEALTEHKSKKAVEDALNDREQKSKEENFRKELNSKVERFETQKDELREVHEDFDDVVDSYDGPQSPAMWQAILDSEASAEIAYYLAKNPEDAEKMASMGLVAANKFVAKIESKLESEKSRVKEAAVKKITSAPPPVTPVGSGKGSTNIDPETMSGDEYLKWRKASKNR